MFKKLVFMIAIMAIAATASAKLTLPFDKYTINRENLPETAREMLDEHFPKAKVSMIKVDRHLLKKTDYDVKLTNGTKIEFSNKGKWTSVDCKKKSVPEGLVPKSIFNSVTKKFPNDKIVRISRSLAYYTIGLSGGKTLKYDKLGIYQGELSKKEAAEFDDEALKEADGEEEAQ